MSDKVKLIVVGVVALIVGAAGGIGYGMIQVDEANQKLAAVTQEKDQAVANAGRLKKMSEDAATKYGKDLGKLVMAASAPAPAGAAPAAPAAGAAGQPPATPAPAADDSAKTLDSARAVLAMRDGFRASLDGVRSAMDSEMDAMATELGVATPNAAKIKELLDTLKQNWPDKEKNLQAATQKLLADLGLAPAPKPAAAPAPAATAPASTAPAPAPADTKK